MKRIMTNHTTNNRKQRRASKPKVKSGCKTCKVRRVKCDEGRPACHKCVLTGRVCDGYGIWGGGGVPYGASGYLSRLPTSRPKSPYTLKPLGLTEDERLGFEFYRLRTSYKLPGVFDSDFWERLIFQAGCEEPAVLHAAIALGSAHRSEMLACNYDEFSMDRDEAPIDKYWSFALQQYNKAIGFLQIHLCSKDIDSLRVALMTCMIFICFEFLRWNFKTGSIHLQNGLRLLNEIQSRKNQQDSMTLVVKSQPTSVDDYLIEAFTRLSVQSALFGQNTQYLYTIPEEARSCPTGNIPPMFESVQAARNIMDRLLNNAYYLLEKSCGLDICSGAVSSGLLQQKAILKSGLTSWLLAYESSLPHLPVSVRNTFGLSILRLYHTMANIITDTCLSPAGEMAFDQHTDAFISIIVDTIDIAKRASRQLNLPSMLTGRGRQPANFTIDMGFLPALYYTALKCRVPHLRRHAIKLLLCSPHREGIWDGEFAASVAREIVKIEEATFYADFDVEDDVAAFDIPEPKHHEVPVLPESSRVHVTRLILPDEGMIGATLQYGQRYNDCRNNQKWQMKSFILRSQHG